jgi:hypothetical protein
MSRLPETALLTALALIAFASNSILTRLALGGGQMETDSRARRRVDQSAQSMTLPHVTSPIAIALPLGEKAMEDG